MSLHPFDDAIALKALEPDRYEGRTSPAYANMVGPYGGITCAALMQAVMMHPQRLGEPIAQTVNYAAPVSDGPYIIEARAVRTNRSTQHWVLSMLQGAGAGAGNGTGHGSGELAVVATATLVTALRRAGWSEQDARAPSPVTPPHELPRLERDEAPPWTRRYEMRFLQGEWPNSFSGIEQDHACSDAWVRDDPPRRLDYPALASICDSFFPRIFIRRQQRVPIGTVSLTTYFHVDEATLRAHGTDHVLGTSRALSYFQGFFDQRAEVWNGQGRLMASTQQTVYYRV